LTNLPILLKSNDNRNFAHCQRNMIGPHAIVPRGKFDIPEVKHDPSRQTMTWSKVFNFTDPDPYRAAIQATDVEMVHPRSKGEFRAELTQIRWGRLWMQRYRKNLPEIYTGKIKPGRKVIAFVTGEQPSFRQNGIELSLRDIVVCNNDVMHHRSEGNSRYGSMSLAIDDFDAACKAIAGHEFSGFESESLVQPSPALMSRLQKLHGTVGQIIKSTPDILESPEVVRALEHELIHVMIRCLTDGVTSSMTSAHRRHDMIVKRFEGFLEANPNEPLYLPEICAALGVGERTLRSACEEHLGMGPIRYLTLRRMHLVRRALQRSDPFTATVTRLATDYGFWELGRFAVTYRTMFGESPKATLHRPADDDYPILKRRTRPDGVVLHS
jgi:AraC-like DNA-binding protein